MGKSGSVSREVTSWLGLFRFEALQKQIKRLKSVSAWGDLGLGLPKFNSVFSGVYSLRVLLFLHQGGPNSLSLSPHWLCSPVSPRELLALGEIKSPRLGLQRGEVGGEIRSGDFQAAREGRACKEKTWVGRAGRILWEKQPRQSLSLGRFSSTEPPLVSSGGGQGNLKPFWVKLEKEWQRFIPN